MAEVLAEFAEPVLSADRKPYRAHVVGGPMPDGMWEAWVEFIPVPGGSPARSPRETTQSNRTGVVYWASGLSPTYLEGALARALKQPVVTITAPGEPVLDASALDFTVHAPQRHVEAVLDPFSVYEKGEVLLRKELGALSSWHLVNIIIAYNLADESEATLDRLPQAALVELIVASVREHTFTR